MKNIKTLFLLMLLPLAALLFLQATAPATTTGYNVGDKASGFNLKNVDGKMVSPADYKDAKGYVVIFTCNHCPFSVAYEDRIINLHKTYAPKGYPVIAINPNDPAVQPEDSFEKMKERSKKKRFPFAYLHDETQEIAKTYGAARTPHVYILDKDMTVKYIGAIDDNTYEPKNVSTKYVENALNELLAGKEITTNFTKAIGCTIKWRKG